MARKLLLLAANGGKAMGAAKGPPVMGQPLPQHRIPQPPV